jgi:hypothetical protein
LGFALTFLPSCDAFEVVEDDKRFLLRLLIDITGLREANL